MITVDDHPLLREGIAAIVANSSDLYLAGEASHGGEAIELYRHLQPDVVVMDIQMPCMDGIEATRQICSEWPDAKIVILTTYAGDVRARQALEAGASAYLLKSMVRTDLVSTIRAVQAGLRVLPQEIATDIAEHASDERLSARETEILQRIAMGGTNRSIGLALGISEDTVKVHVRNILGKLGASDRTQAVTLALRRGILSV